MNKLCYRIKSKLFPYKPPPGYTFEKPYPQNFPFPIYLMKYIALNPSTPKLWKKLVKTCKFFYSKNPLILCDRYSHGKNVDEISISWKRVFLTFKADAINFNVWLTDWFFDNRHIVVETMTSNVYKNDLKQLWLIGMTISFDDMNILGLNGKLESLHLLSATVQDNNGSVVTLEEIAEIYPNLLFLSYRYCQDNSITQKTAQKLIEIYHPTTSKRMQKPLIWFTLSFADDLPDDCKERIKDGVNEIVATNKTIFPPQRINLKKWDDGDLLWPCYLSLRQRIIYTYKGVKYFYHLEKKNKLQWLVKGHLFY